MELYEQLALVMMGGRVKRFHTKFMVQEERVAEHHHVVAWLAVFYWRHVHNALPTSTLLMACLSHDLAEYRLGDIPSPTKRLLPGLKQAMDTVENDIFKMAGLPRFETLVTLEEAEVLKWADNFAGWLKCLYERALGNKTLTVTEHRYRSYVEEIVDTSEYLNTEFCRSFMRTIFDKGIPV